jgi:hypothetical protein
MADAEVRATARYHTARLLKMLRGYGPTAGPESAPGSAVASPAAAVAEATSAYVRQASVVSNPPLPSPEAQASPAPLPRGLDEPDSIPTVGEILRRPTGVLGRLMVQASRLNRLSQIFHAYLPAHLRDHATLIQLDAEGWEVQTDSASWATRLRYALPTIRQALGQQVGITLPKPRIRVVPAAMPDKPRRPPLKLTRRSAELLETTARDLTDPELSAALRRLAAHGRSRPGPGT